MHVSVIGGGITGLTAAHILATHGASVTLLEASGRLGGKAMTEHVEGFLIEHGPDSFVRSRPAATQLADELGLSATLVGPLDPRLVHVITDRRSIPLPDGMGLVLPTRFGPFLRTRLFSVPQKLRMALDLALPRSDLTHDVAVGIHLRRRLGRGLVDRLAGPLLGNIYGTPIDELSLLATLPQLREAELTHRSLVLASIAAGRAHGSVNGSSVTTLAGGVGQLVAGLVGSLERSSHAAVRTSTIVTGCDRTGGRLTIRLATGEVIRPDATIITVPGPEAARLLEDVVPAAAAGLRTIRHGTTVVVSLGYRAEQFDRPPVGHGFVVGAGEALSVDACTISSSKWPNRAPDGNVLLRVFFGARSQQTAAMSDRALAGAAARDVAATLGPRGAPLLVRVARWQDVMPRYTVGHLDRVAAIFAATAAVPGLVLAGASYRGAGIPDCIGQGVDAAARVMAT